MSKPVLEDNIYRLLQSIEKRIGAIERALIGSSESISLLRGTITSTGTVTNGIGFSSSRSSAGVYVITFDIAFSAAPIGIALPDNTLASPDIKTTASSTASVTINTFVSTTGTLTDSGFQFIIAGPR